MSTKPIDPTKKYNIKDAAALLDILPFHMHELVLPKADKPARIPATKEQIPGTKTFRWMILGKDLIHYAETRKTAFGKRSDGRNKFTVHLNAAELAKVQAFLKTLPGTDIKRANPPKSQ